MKRLHRPDLYSWSVFDEDRNIDFHGLLWVRDGGNVMIDPVAMSDHDIAHVAELGGVRHIVVTNSDHVRDAAALRDRHAARLLGPAAEAEQFPVKCDAWLDDGDEIVPGLVVHTLDGSKTPGELALILDTDTLVTGDLVRAHAGGQLMLLPDAKLSDKAAALDSVRRLARRGPFTAVLPGDGWPVFRDGSAVLDEMLARSA